MPYASFDDCDKDSWKEPFSVAFGTMKVPLLTGVAVGLSGTCVFAFSSRLSPGSTRRRWTYGRRHPTASQEDVLVQLSANGLGSSPDTRQQLDSSVCRVLSCLVAAGVIAAGNGDAAMAYKADDYASEAVVTAIKSLKESSGNVEQTFKNYENIGTIITEGRGVGGVINYKGVQLDRGYIADEDTSIYNPGLTLLTESEKERLVEAVIQSRKDNLNQGQWSEQNQLAYDFLRDKLDPLHTTELRGYLAVFPFYTAAIYLAALAVQQFARDIFPVAYLVGVTAIVAPILIIIAAGP